MREEARRACGKDFLLFPGEELSAQNGRGNTVHLGVVNPPEFLEGYGDSGRHLRRTCPHSVREIPDRLSTRDEALCFAAHPGYRPRLLERLLLKRGSWRPGDYPGTLVASQFWNGGMDAAFFRGRRQWISLLLEGRRIAPLAGNDAHGDFSRVRKISFPFFSVAEDTRSGFGRVRTAVRTDDFSFAGVLSGIRQCRTVVTNGPFITLSALDLGLGDTVAAREFTLDIKALSSPEFGPLSRVTLYKGTLGKTEEKALDLNLKNEKTFSRTIPFQTNAREKCYFRAEVSSGAGNDVFLGMTSPLWAEPA
jgi:hypothetical protein